MGEGIKADLIGTQIRTEIQTEIQTRIPIRTQIQTQTAIAIQDLDIIEITNGVIMVIRVHSLVQVQGDIIIEEVMEHIIIQNVTKESFKMTQKEDGDHMTREITEEINEMHFELFVYKIIWFYFFFFLFFF